MSIISSRLEPSPNVKTPEPLETHKRIVTFLKRVIDICLHGLVFLIPLFFSTVTLDSVELNKQTILIVVASIAGIAWIGQALAEKRFTIVRSWLHLVTVLFGLGYLVVALFSQDRYQSLVGTLGQMPWAFSTVVALIVIYIVTVHHVRSVSQVYDFILSFLVSSSLVAVYGLLQMSGVYILAAADTHVNVFTSVGSAFSLAVFLVVPIIISASLLFHGCRNKVCMLGSEKPLGRVARVLVWAMMLTGLAALIVVDFWVAWAGLLFGTLLTALIGWLRNRKIHHPVKLIVPGVLVAVAVVFLFVDTPIHLNIPAEASPSISASWSIGTKTLEQTPLVGSGPGTWVYDYSKYREAFVNQSRFWNVRFDRGFSFFLTLIATTGLVGVVLWFILIISGIVKSTRHLISEKDDDVWYAYLIVFSGWSTLVFLTFFYNLNMAHFFALWLLFALLGSLVGKNVLTWNAQKSAYTYGAISVLFVVLVVGGVSVSWLAGQRYVADVYFTKAVRSFRAGDGIDGILPSVQRAASLNPLNDIYTRNLSQAYLVQASNLLQAEQPNQQAINAAIGSAVEEAIAATKASPANVDNWSNLGIVYESIASRVAGADEAAVNAFTEAVKLEPFNPVLYSEIGKIHLLSADSYAKSAEQKDEAKAAEAAQNRDKNLSQAEDSLKKAIALKLDYLPARYYLGIVYERQRNIPSAIAELENVLRINNKDVGVAFELAILYYRNDQKDQSLSLLEQIVTKFDANNANAKWYLSAMYEERGRYDDAIKQLEDLAKLYPDNGAVKQRLTILQDARASSLAPEAASTLPAPIEQKVSNPKEQNPL